MSVNGHEGNFFYLQDGRYQTAAEEELVEAAGDDIFIDVHLWRYVNLELGELLEHLHRIVDQQRRDRQVEASHAAVVESSRCWHEDALPSFDF